MKNEKGFHLTALLLAVVVIGAIGFAGWKVYDSRQTDKASPSQDKQTQLNNQAASSDVVWIYDEASASWRPNTTAPECPSPLKLANSPVDVGKATSVLYPGQTRGQYKAHGGFRFDGLDNADVEVKVPMDSKVILGSRYIESGEVQYMFDLIAPCGIMFRFDHLLTLSPEFQKLADQLPEAKVDDSRTTNFSSPLAVKAGDVIATAVGHTKPTANVGMDFGVYDLRSQNQASKDNPSLGQKPGTSVGYAHFGVCWFDTLPGNDAAKVKSLPAGDQAMGKTSDYCK